MKCSYEISQFALDDLKKIWEYTVKRWSIGQANKYYNEIFKIINKICANPEIGKSLNEVKHGHRKINVKFHIVIYKFKNDKIYIDRILHKNMDVDARLND